MASSEVYEVVLSGGAPWGFRLQGGREFRAPLRIAKVGCHEMTMKFKCHVRKRVNASEAEMLRDSKTNCEPAKSLFTLHSTLFSRLLFQTAIIYFLLSLH